MEKESLSIRKNIIALTWYMRGGIQYETMMNMSQQELKLVNEVIESNLETAKKTGRDFW